MAAQSGGPHVPSGRGHAEPAIRLVNRPPRQRSSRRAPDPLHAWIVLAVGVAMAVASLLVAEAAAHRIHRTSGTVAQECLQQCPERQTFLDADDTTGSAEPAQGAASDTCVGIGLAAVVAAGGVCAVLLAARRVVSRPTRREEWRT